MNVAATTPLGNFQMGGRWGGGQVKDAKKQKNAEDTPKILKTKP